MSKMCEICGNEFITNRRNKKTCSSQCSHALQRRTMGRAPSQIHGFAKPGAVEPLHGTWRSILKRCTCKTDSNYQKYGGRGITICDEWANDYVAFRTWALANGYSASLTIDRIDNNGPYSPDNCRFATKQEQARNRRTSVLFDYDGRMVTIAELSEISGVPYCTLRYRLKRMPIDQAMGKNKQAQADWKAGKIQVA